MTRQVVLDARTRLLAISELRALAGPWRRDLHGERARVIRALRAAGGTWEDVAVALGVSYRQAVRMYGPNGKGRL